MTRDVTRVAVIGGGIAGPVTALALHRIGVEATIYEAYEHGAEHAGAFLTTASNGLAALELLGAHAAVLAAGFPTPRFAISNGNGKRLADVDELGSRVRARFADGSSITADLLVGADGLRSRTRMLVDPAAPTPRYLGLLGCGGYAGSAGPDSPPGVFHFVFGRRAFFGYVVPEPGRVSWFANLPHQPEPTRSELDGLRGESLRAVLLEAFATDRIPAAEVIRGTEHLVDALPMHDLTPLPTWHRRRMVLVGDAAHVTSPSSGQGASLAIEDAVILAQCLRDLPDHTQAFNRYQQLRWQRVKEVFDSAARVNRDKAAGPVARRVRDMVIPLVLKLVDPAKAQAAMQDYTIDWNKRLLPA